MLSHRDILQETVNPDSKVARQPVTAQTGSIAWFSTFVSGSIH